ncbi:zinc-ribbon domain-containing protein [Pseudalkalibacillus sp. Hm43]|uniref:zinc ribbon domain-containing protein n=1 Tax=Pseudalkalibacillus sp. Hm43 TaxID=3450742 RepID=UPI003F437DC4
MYCSNCGKQLQIGDTYCLACGSKRLPTVDETTKKMKRWQWLAPLLAFILVTTSLAGYFYSEHRKTEAAIQAFDNGEKAALDGDYKKAKQAFQTALDHRSDFKAATENMRLIEDALHIQERLNISEKHIEEKAFDKASEQIQKAESTLRSYTGKVASALDQKITSNENALNIAHLQYDMEGKSTLDELEPLLTKADAIQSPEAEQIAEEIRKRIAEIAYVQANDFLTDNQFSAALASVKKGLYHEPKSKKLLSLKTTIHNEQVAFEQAEQKRIEQAIVAAAEEKEHNLNNAIKLNSIEAKMNHLGDIIVTGTIKSQATVPIGSIRISYTLTDQDGKIFDKNEVFVYPDILYPDETGTFEYTHYLVNEELNVKFNEADWHVN